MNGEDIDGQKNSDQNQRGMNGDHKNRRYRWKKK